MKFYVSVTTSSLHFIYAYFISLIHDLKKSLCFFFPPSKTLFLELFLNSTFCVSTFTVTCLYPYGSFLLPPSRVPSLCIANCRSSLMIEICHGVNSPLTATLTLHSMIWYVVFSAILSICNYDFYCCCCHRCCS